MVTQSNQFSCNSQFSHFGQDRYIECKLTAARQKNFHLSKCSLIFHATASCSDVTCNLETWSRYDSHQDLRSFTRNNIPKRLILGILQPTKYTKNNTTDEICVCVQYSGGSLQPFSFDGDTLECIDLITIKICFHAMLIKFVWRLHGGQPKIQQKPVPNVSLGLEFTLEEIPTCLETFKVAPSFWFLNINMPIFFVETVFKLSQEDVV